MTDPVSKDILPEFAALYTKYLTDKVLPNGDNVPNFKDWFVTLSDLQKLDVEAKLSQGRLLHDLKEYLGAKYDKNMSFLMKKYQALSSKYLQLEGELEGEISKREKTKATSLASLKTPKTMDRLIALNKVINVVNRGNARRRSQGKKLSKWGPDGRTTSIDGMESLKGWLNSKQAATYGLKPEILEDFRVVVYFEELVTLSKDFEGGIGFEVLWTPFELFNKTLKRAKTWASPDHYRKDPRRAYVFNNKAWSPIDLSGSKNKKEKKLKRKTFDGRE